MYTENELNEFEQFFKSIPDSVLPTEIEVVKAQKVVDVKRFYENHLAAARANLNNLTFSAFHARLGKLRDLLK
jgi:hypothetical protein